jgi:hypothetical protein
MAIKLPNFQNDGANFLYNVDLEEINLEIRFTYNERSESWILNLATANYNLNGIKLVKDFPLLWRHQALFPELKGDLICLKISDEINDIDLTYDSLGVNWALFYLTQTELDEWKTAKGLM